MKYILVAKISSNQDDTLRDGDDLEILGDGKSIYECDTEEEAERIKVIVAVKEKRPIFVMPKEHAIQNSDLLAVQLASQNMTREFITVVNNAMAIEGFKSLTPESYHSAIISACCQLAGNIAAQSVRKEGPESRERIENFLKRTVIGAFEEVLAMPIPDAPMHMLEDPERKVH